MKIKKIITLILLFIATALVCIPSPSFGVRADTGPKPDMEITIINLPESDYIVAYATPYKDYFGPHHSFDPNKEERKESWYGNSEDLTIIFNKVELPEGWYLSDISSSYNGASNIVVNSGYMWPDDFILIIFDKLTSKYYLSEETKTYAFHSYFKVDMSQYVNASFSLEKCLDTITFKKTYNYGKEILGFFLRLILTLGIEMLLAFIFRFDKKSMIIILISNFITQLFLNILLNVFTFKEGKQLLMMPFYAFLEILIIGIEAAIYLIFCKRGKKQTKWGIASYALVANILSFAAGMFFWILL